MRAGEWVYVQPDTAEEAVAAYGEFSCPMYYAGGSEILTMSRAGSLSPDALIDLKRLPEARALGIEGDALVIGSCVTLREIRDSRLFPLLGSACGRIADHTNQCRITLGGNLCGSIIYREAAQALLVSDAELVLFCAGGVRTVGIHAAFHRCMQLAPGEMVIQARIPKSVLGAPYSHVKKTTQEKIDYPLVSLSAVRIGGQLRAAFSGIQPYPFRSAAAERALNDAALNAGERLEQALSCLPRPMLTDLWGSAGYREFVLRQTLRSALEVLER